MRHIFLTKINSSNSIYVLDKSRRLVYDVTIEFEEGELNMEFDRQKLIENINTLIQQKHMKVGEVEQAIGISTGYLSRLSKPSNESIPATDIVWKLARHFEVSTDALIAGDFSAGMDNVSVLKRFISKLTIQTMDGLLDWRPITSKYVNSVLQGKEPLFFLVKQTESDNGVPDMEFDFNSSSSTFAWYHNRRIASASAPEDPAWMLGNGYMTTLPNGNRLSLFHMCAEVDTATPGSTVELPYYEMYMEERIKDSGIAAAVAALQGNNSVSWNATQVFGTLGAGGELEEPARELYSFATQNAYDLKIETGVKSTIMSFLNDDLFKEEKQPDNNADV